MLTAKALVESSVQLYTLPDVYLRLKATIDKGDFALADIAAVISQDPGLTARLLRMVNSAYFGLASKIETVSQAVNMLGADQIHDLALSTSVTEAFSGIPENVINMDGFWRNSVRCGMASRFLAYRCNVLDSERLFVAGLLQDIGHLVMFHRIPEQTFRAFEAARDNPQLMHLSEQDIIGFDFAEVGAALMEAWNFPLSLYEVVAFQNSPQQARNHPLEVSLVHIAKTACAVPLSEDWKAKIEACIDPEALAITEIATDSLDAVVTEANKKADQALNLIFPSTRKAS